MTNAPERTVENTLAGSWTACQQGADALAQIGRSTPGVTDLARAVQGTVNAVISISQTTTRGMLELSQGAAAYSRQNFEETQAAIEKLASVKSPAEFLQVQQDFARRRLASGFAELSRFGDAVQALMNDIAAPVAERLSAACSSAGKNTAAAKA